MNCPFQYRPNTSDSELKYIPFIIYPPACLTPLLSDGGTNPNTKTNPNDDGHD